MTSVKFDPQPFFARPDSLAARVAASEVFGLLRRSLDLPAQWAALLTRTAGDYVVVASGGTVAADGVDEILLVRTSPLEVAVTVDEVPSSDGHACRAEVRVRLAVIPDRAELLSFVADVLGSRRAATVTDLVRRLEPSVSAAIAAFAAEHTAADLIEGAGGAANPPAAALAKALQPVCFESGVSLDGEPVVRFNSTSLRDAQRGDRHAARARKEQDVARELQEAMRRTQHEHLDHLSGLLARLNELSTASPNMQLADLIKTFSDRQRGQLYEALFAAPQAGTKTRWIVVAAGDELILFDPEAPSAPARRIPISGSAGQVRSVQAATAADGQIVLLLGAATGVYRVPLVWDRPLAGQDSMTGQRPVPQPDLTLSIPAAPAVRGGFNAVAMAAGRIVASHSELGLWEWVADGGWRMADGELKTDVGSSSPRRLFESMTRGAKAIRAVQLSEGFFYAAIDDRAIRWRAAGDASAPDRIYVGAGATITALAATRLGLFAGTSEGDVLHWPAMQDGYPERLHGGGRRAVESLWLSSTSGIDRLVFTDTSLAVHARVVGDSFACRYEAGGQTLRRVDVADDLLVATNDIRDRLFLFHPGHPERPSAVIPVSAMTGRSVQDVCLV